MISFNKPYMTGNELTHIANAHRNFKLAGDGEYTERCENWIQNVTGCKKALLTHSCTAALEMAAMLADIGPGDEVILPSYTFVSTANAFVLRGATPVFVDIRHDTLNIDERLIEAAVTERTKAIVPVHYAGVGCNMTAIMEIANRHQIIVIEDAAQGVLAAYRNEPLGAIGHMGCFSFHETKNIISGEGGALLINDGTLVERAEIIREKGTNRKNFALGKVDKYTWVDIGSSFLPGEIIAAFLWAQLEEADDITSKRLNLWQAYNLIFSGELPDGWRTPYVPDYCANNGHIFYLLAKSEEARTHFLEQAAARGVNCVFHYIPLHSSPLGRRVGRVSGSMDITDRVSRQIVRLPLWIGLDVNEVSKKLKAIF